MTSAQINYVTCLNIAKHFVLTLTIPADARDSQYLLFLSPDFSKRTSCCYRRSQPTQIFNGANRRNVQ